MLENFEETRVFGKLCDDRSHPVVNKVLVNSLLNFLLLFRQKYLGRGL